MPFVGTKRAKLLLKRQISCEKVGDICCLAYEPMVQKALVNRSWTTFHRIKKEVIDGTWEKNYVAPYYPYIPMHLKGEIYTSIKLAWEVFFCMYVLPYEKEKKKMNGGVINKKD